MATTIGVSPTLINRLAQGASLKDDTPQNQEKLRIHRRFWISLMLQQLIKEEPLSKVSESFGIERGFLQSLCSTTAGFASMVQKFCSRLGWGSLAMLLGGFKERLVFGLLPLIDNNSRHRCSWRSFGFNKVTVCQGIHCKNFLGRRTEEYRRRSRV